MSIKNMEAQLHSGPSFSIASIILNNTYHYLLFLLTTAFKMATVFDLKQTCASLEALGCPQYNQIIILQTKAYSDPGKLLTGHDLSVYKEKRALLTLIKNY
ncbi:uncharacterized protein FPRN_06866 [Fusarium proliferatum]|nr:uncharacterized protein FPRN_06866 [Fusarium proliferatum]